MGFFFCDSRACGVCSCFLMMFLLHEHQFKSNRSRFLFGDSGAILKAVPALEAPARDKHAFTTRMLHEWEACTRGLVCVSLIRNPFLRGEVTCNRSTHLTSRIPGLSLRLCFAFYEFLDFELWVILWREENCTWWLPGNLFGLISSLEDLWRTVIRISTLSWGWASHLD